MSDIFTDSFQWILQCSMISRASFRKPEIKKSKVLVQVHLKVETTHSIMKKETWVVGSMESMRMYSKVCKSKQKCEPSVEHSKNVKNTCISSQKHNKAPTNLNQIENKTAAQTADADTSQSNFTNRQNPPIQQNCCNSWKGSFNEKVSDKAVCRAAPGFARVC